MCVFIHEVIIFMKYICSLLLCLFKEADSLYALQTSYAHANEKLFFIIMKKNVLIDYHLLGEMHLLKIFMIIQKFA